MVYKCFDKKSTPGPTAEPSSLECSSLERCSLERSLIQSNCATCGSKKSRFIKEQQAMGILSNLGIKTPLSKVLLLNILF